MVLITKMRRCGDEEGAFPPVVHRLPTGDVYPGAGRRRSPTPIFGVVCTPLFILKEVVVTVMRASLCIGRCIPLFNPTADDAVVVVTVNMRDAQACSALCPPRRRIVKMETEVCEYLDTVILLQP